MGERTFWRGWFLSKLQDFGADECALRTERGGMLVFSLWLTVFLGSLVVMLAGQILTEGRVSQAYAGRLQESLALETMRSRFQVAVALDKTPTFDSLKDPWGHNPALFDGVQVGESSAVRLSLEAGGLAGAQDEERFVNVNQASLRLLQQLFAHGAGLPDEEAQRLAAAVQDWRDKDVFASHPQYDTEGAEYADTYACKNDLFESREELLLVSGMTEEIYRAVGPLTTVYGRGKVNVNTAPAGVLKVLGAPDGLVEKLVDLRAGDDGAPGTDDDTVFESVGDVQPKLQSRWGNLDTDEQNALGRMLSEGWLDVRSEAFTLPVRVTAHGRSTTRSMTLDREGHVLEIGS